MQAGDLKPVLAALVLPPAGPLLIALAALCFARRLRAAAWLAGLMVAGTLLLSCRWCAVLLAQALLPTPVPVDAAQLRQVQAIVVLGGGIEDQAPEYGQPQLTAEAYQRLRYGMHLARASGKPLAFAGGQGWSVLGTTEAEARVAERVLRQDFGLPLRWLEDRSRDTRENAFNIAAAMRPDGVRRIALVTDAWHIPRATRYFQAAGLEVLAAPMDFPYVRKSVLDLLPSADGLVLSRQVLREGLGLVVQRLS